MKMKKFLLGTTALISISAASAAMAGGSHAPAAAEPANTGGLTVMVGGKFNFQSAFIDQDIDALAATDFAGNSAEKSQLFRNDTQLHFTAAGSTEDFDYGAVIELEADSSGQKNAGAGANPNNADKTYLFVENDGFGRFEAGANSGASETLEVDASKVARGTGGVDGDWKYNLATDLTGGAVTTYLLDPNLAVANVDDNGPDSNKITYYTPRFGGLQLGLSFVPDSGDNGSASGISSINTVTGTTPDFSNVVTGGLNYEADLDGIGLMASAVGEHGSAQNVAGADRNDLSAYSLGLGAEMGGFSVAGNYADLGDSGLLTTATVNDETTYWSLGAGYENGPYGVSVTYFDSTRGTGAAAGAGTDTGENTVTNLVVGADYQMAPGLTPFVEASFFELDAGTTTAATDNDGNVVLVGAELAF